METGCVQAFQGGRIYTTPGSGTHALTGAIGIAWGQQGYEKGPLGYAMLKKLKCDAGEQHPHTAQQPKALEI